MINYAVEQNVAVIRWHLTSSPMNVLNDESIPAFEAALERAYADPAVTGVIITSDKPEFVAGADLNMILRNNRQPPADMLTISTELNRIFRRIETSGKPTVAAINGTALGGGYEICLACHHRIALNNAKTQIGLVEVTLGLLPGGGGTQRLPRLIGIRAALSLLLDGTKLNVPDALTHGLIDDVADTPAALLEKARTWIRANPHPVKPWDRLDPKTGRIVARDDVNVPGGDVQSPAGGQAFSAGTALVMARTKGNYPAPLAILSCVYEGLQVNIDRGIQIEGRYFVEVARSAVARNLIETMFLGLNATNKGVGRPKDVPRTETKKIGVLGAGTTGVEIACVSARAGIDVVLIDASPDMAEQGKAYARTWLNKGVERGRLAAVEAAAALNRITPTTHAAYLAGCNVLFDATSGQSDQLTAVQNAIKAVQPNLAFDDQSGPVVLVSAPSTLSITDLARVSANPANGIGMHFAAPIDTRTLVELMVGEQTSDYALAVAMDFARKLRKTPVVGNASRGSYTIRGFSTYAAEGMELLRDGVNPVLIENAGKAAGMPEGPLAMHDEMPLLLDQASRSGLAKVGTLSADSAAEQLMQRMNSLGRTGKQAGAGFYEYPAAGAPAEATKHLWPGLADWFPVAAQQPSLDEVKTRTQLDGDLGSILGWGFPAYTGGALSFVDFVGVAQFVSTCDRLADQYGDRFRPTETLRNRAAAAVSV